MDLTNGFELPETLKPMMKKARVLEWITIGYVGGRGGMSQTQLKFDP